MVDSVLSTPKSSWKMTDLSGPDRSWLVAGLTLAGVTAQDIADRLSCSLRLVRTIRAEDMTQVCYLAQQQLKTMADDLRQAELTERLTSRELTKSQAETERVQGQLDQITDRLMKGTLEAFPRCGHPKVDWNVYTHTDRSVSPPKVREYCRECNAGRATSYRERLKKAKSEGESHDGVMISDPDDQASGS